MKNVSSSSQENKIMLDGIIHLFYEYVNTISEEELFKICGESDALYDFILSKLIDGRRDEVAEDDFAIGVIGPLITEAFSHGKKERGLALALCLIKCCEKYIFMNDEYSKIKKKMVFGEKWKNVYIKSYLEAIPSYAKENKALVNKKLSMRGFVPRPDKKRGGMNLFLFMVRKLQYYEKNLDSFFLFFCHLL